MKQESANSHRYDIQQISPEDTSRTRDLVENRLRGRMGWGYVEHVSVRTEEYPYNPAVHVRRCLTYRIKVQGRAE